MRAICRDTRLCAGCTACANICPQKCIEMIENEEGFLYPQVDESRCVNCNLCEKTCPINTMPKINQANPKTRVARTLDNKLLEQCSSGGVFTTLAKTFIESNGVVYGVIYDTNFNVVHQRIDSEEDVARLAGSKYVQSFLGDAFQQIKVDLLRGKPVLFCGTPCQVAGLRNYLKKDYADLYCVDLVCHGVPSPKIWRQYLEVITKRYGKVRTVNIRSKTLADHVSVMEENFSDGRKVRGSARTNMMSKIFFKNIADRYSCYDCQFKTVSRCSDLTIYDSWHADKLVPGLKDDDKGYTNVIIQSSKGQYMVDNFFKDNITTYDVDTLKAIELDGSMATKSVVMHDKRNVFYNAINNEGIVSSVNKFLPIEKKDYLIEKLKLFLYSVGILRSAKRVKEQIKVTLKK